MNPDWQNKFTSMKERNGHLLKSGIRSDCCFLVGVVAEDQKIFNAHKLILATASPVFETMFYGSIPEKGDAPIEFDDIDAEDFSDILFFIYNEEITITSVEKAQQIYCIADRFMIQQLMRRCIEFLKISLTPENVFQNFDFAQQFDLINLKDRCVQVAKYETSEVLTSPSFLQANISFLNLLLLQDELNISSELDLFNALQRYAEFRFTIDERRKPISVKYKATIQMKSVENANSKSLLKNINESDSSDEKSTELAECNAKSKEEQQHLKDAEHFLKVVKRIRFLTMKPEEFATGPGMSKLLSAEDAIAISVCLIEPTNVEKYFPTNFCDSTKDRLTPYCDGCGRPTNECKCG